MKSDISAFGSESELQIHIESILSIYSNRSGPMFNSKNHIISNGMETFLNKCNNFPVQQY